MKIKNVSSYKSHKNVKNPKDIQILKKRRIYTMNYNKQRIFAVIITLVSIAMLCQAWHDARHNGGYYLKAAAFAPVGIVAGIFLTFFPQFFGKPETTREKIVTLTVYGCGLLLGLYNWYLIDPSLFSF